MDRRGNFVSSGRRIAAGLALVLVVVFAVSALSLSDGTNSVPTINSLPARTPIHRYAVRTGTVYPLELPPATPTLEHHSRPLHVADPAAYRMRKAALAAGAALSSFPSFASLAATATTPTVSTNFQGLDFSDSVNNSDCGMVCEPPDTQAAAGPENIVEVVNVVGKIFDKSGNTLMATWRPSDSCWAS